MRLEPGMLIKTNYSGPYRIQSIKRDCTCPLYIDEINMADPPPTPSHIHIVCTMPGGSGKYWLGHWLEDSLLSLTKSYCGGKTELDYDRIEVLPSDQPIQLTMFDGDD